MTQCALRRMTRTSILCASLLLGGCVGSSGPPLVTSVDTLCTSTTRYHATDGQIAAFKADQALWGPLVAWLASFNKVRDADCLKPAGGN